MNTTSHFSEDAYEYVNRIDVKLVLIDGVKLARMMYEHDLGVQVEQRFEVKRIDEDFFEER